MFMNTTTPSNGQPAAPTGQEFFDHVWEKSWTYIKTVVDIVREPVVILNKDLHVMTANESFYRTFQVEPRDTEDKSIYELGNGQWNIPALKKLLEDILPKNTFFKGFEVAHDFPFIGRKVMILNARQMHFHELNSPAILPPIILLAMEDVSEMMVVAETLAGHANHVEEKLAHRTQKLELQIKKLEKEVINLKSKL